MTDSSTEGSTEGSTDWRVTITLPSQAAVGKAKHAVSDHAVEADVRARLGRDIAVGSGDHRLFLYAGTEVAAREAERVAREVLSAEGIEAEYALHRWHPIEEDWESLDVPMPQTQAERAAEHERLEAEEAAQSQATGTARWEARVELPSHREAVALAGKLRAEGWPVTRRWKFLVVGAGNEDEARELAERIRREGPPDASVSVEPSGMRLPFIPF